jgi:hypothetical protein
VLKMKAFFPLYRTYVFKGPVRLGSEVDCHEGGSEFISQLCLYVNVSTHKLKSLALPKIKLFDS